MQKDMDKIPKIEWFLLLLLFAYRKGQLTVDYEHMPNIPFLMKLAIKFGTRGLTKEGIPSTSVGSTVTRYYFQAMTGAPGFLCSPCGKTVTAPTDIHHIFSTEDAIF